jgi:tRNA dimethylallyltransferase
MSQPPAQLPLVAIVGPTASGKSTLAVWLAHRLFGEIIACDSTQLYRGFNIGTAKPDVSERQSIPHHLLDVLSPEEAATAGRYRELALAALDNLRHRIRLPIFTVGTGLYLRALLKGLADVPQRSEELRERLRYGAAQHGPGYLHGVLQHLDAEAARKIAPADEQKLIRAIEVCLLAKKPLSDVHRTGRAPLQGWRALKLGLMPPRDALYERIHARTDAMLERGWLEEVRTLLGTGVHENAKPFDFIGYRELRGVLRGEITLEQARTAIQQATRRYAKRQLTWFRKEPGVHWLAGLGDKPQIQNEALAWIKSQNSIADSTRSIRDSYDRIADEYTRRIYDELQHKPLDQQLLHRFVAQVAGRGDVCDMGCGPGHVARFLRDAGAAVFGLDLSPQMLEQARRLDPGIPFREGNMLALDLEDASLAGITALYAIVNIPKERLPIVFREMHRVLKPGGLLLLGFHVGSEQLHETELWGRPISMDFFLLQTSDVRRDLEGAGFAIEEIVERDPYSPEVEYQSRRAYIFARKPNAP